MRALHCLFCTNVPRSDSRRKRRSKKKERKRSSSRKRDKEERRKRKEEKRQKKEEKRRRKALEREASPQAPAVQFVEKSEGAGAPKHESSDDDVEIGPSLPPSADSLVGGKASYGGQLLPGEGSAMAAYVQSGKRIPRRGEIGLRTEDIEKFEGAGFVMSGSRCAFETFRWTFCGNDTDGLFFFL